MKLSKIELKKFRCFEQITVDITNSIVLIEGGNGTGKTSLLESLYYACYLRSFRSHIPKEMIQFDQDGFFIRVNFDSTQVNMPISQEIQIGFTDGKRLVKVNKKTVHSYKELINQYKVISLTEDDLMIIKGNPQERRSFIDQAILLDNIDFIESVKEYKQILDNRNSLLRHSKFNFDRSNYEIWTQQLWKKTQIIQSMRSDMLNRLAQVVNQLVAEFFDDKFAITISYVCNKTALNQTYEQFLQSNVDLQTLELRYGRSLFGAHLDDFMVHFQNKHSKRLASRGQQKLIIILLKVAQMRLLAHMGMSGIFLLDDFMTDFDAERAIIVVNLLQQMETQLIFTSPAANGILENYLQNAGAQMVRLTL